VSLSVAVILYDAGLTWTCGSCAGTPPRRDQADHPRVPVTLAFGAVSAVLLLGMSAGAAVMTGAILVVSGPTVVARPP
jgi:hypothetical protein